MEKLSLEYEDAKEKDTGGRDHENAIGALENPITVQSEQELIDWGIDPEWISSAMSSPQYMNAALFMLANDDVRSMFGDLPELYIDPSGVTIGDDFTENDVLAATFRALCEAKNMGRQITQDLVQDISENFMHLTEWRVYVPYDMRRQVAHKGQAKLTVNALEVLLPLDLPQPGILTIGVIGSSSPGERAGLAYLALADVLEEKHQQAEIHLYDIMETPGELQLGGIKIVGHGTYINEPAMFDVVIDDRWTPTMPVGELPEVVSKSKVYSRKQFSRRRKFQAYYPNDGVKKMEHREMNFKYYLVPKFKQKCYCAECCYIEHLFIKMKLNERTASNLRSLLYTESNHDMMGVSQDYWQIKNIQMLLRRNGEMNYVDLLQKFTPTVVNAVVGNFSSARGIRGVKMKAKKITTTMIRPELDRKIVSILQRVRVRHVYGLIRGYAVGYPAKLDVLESDYALLACKENVTEFRGVLSFFSLPKVFIVDLFLKEEVLRRTPFIDWKETKVDEYYLMERVIKEVVPSQMVVSKSIRVYKENKKTYTHTAVILVHRIVDGKKKYLFLFKHGNSQLGKVDLPKGRQEVGESIEDCAKRELREETGMSAVLKQVAEFNVNYNKNSLRTRMFVFEAKVIGVPTVKLSKEHKDYAWLSDPPNRSEEWIKKVLMA
jgi:8-oxo-dGTP pyrophosphatase MutT (NUDIX family)